MPAVSDSTDLVFYHAFPSRAITVHWMLEELGVPYTLKTLDLQKDEHRTADYLAINPMGKVPAIVHKGVAVSEVAAICTYLADAFPEAGLAVPIGDPLRGPYLKWLFFASGCIEPAVSDRLFQRPPATETAIGYGSHERVMQVLDEAVAASRYLVGGRFTAADLLIGAQLGWGIRFAGIDPTPAMTDYVARLQARPAWQRSMRAAPSA